VGRKARSSEGEVPRLPPYKYHPVYVAIVMCWCTPLTPLSLVATKPRKVETLWYRLTRVVLEYWPVNDASRNSNIINVTVTTTVIYWPVFQCKA